MKQFKPIPVRNKYIKEIAHGVSRSIYESFFKPLFDVIDSNTIDNAKNAVVEALNNGKIYYENGAFRTQKNFSNAVALELEKIGAKYKYGAYYIDRAVLPLEIENAIALLAARSAATLAALDVTLLALAQNLTKDTLTQFFIQKTAEKMFKTLQYELEESVKQRAVPVIDMSTEIPDLNIPEATYKNIDTYYANLEEKKNKGKNKGKNKDKGGADKGNGNDNKDLTPPSQSDSKDPNKDENKGEDKDKGNTQPPAPDKGSTETTAPPKILLDDYELDKQAQKIAQDYTYNMDYWVKNWKAKEIVKMRRTVLDMAQKGTRKETIQKYLMNRWKIAENKAAFLARNESNIASSVIKAVFYQEKQGCKYFMWLESVSKEKRQLHLEYAKKSGNQYGIGGTNIFAFDNPPVIEQVAVSIGRNSKGNKEYIYVPKTNGKKGLPGQTYNCECDFIGIFNPDYYVNQEKKKNAERNIIKQVQNALSKCFKRRNTNWRYRRLGEG